MIEELPVNAFKRNLKLRTPQIGLWMTLCSATSTEIAAGAGFDFLVIDMEHSPNDVPDVVDYLRAMAHKPCEAVVRIPWNDPVLVKRLLDAGVRTLLVPFVQSAEEAASAVAATRYPPHGMRGVAATSRATGFGRVSNYFARAADEICVIVQIETRKAVSQIDAIADVDGVDGVFIGPADLSADFGYPNDWSRPEIWKTIKEAGARIQAAGKSAGFLSGRSAECEELLADGFGFVAVGGDASILARNLDSLAAGYSRWKR